MLVVEQCNPEWFSVPLEGYCYYDGIAQYADVTLVTHERNKAALDKAHPDRKIIYIYESEFIKKYARLAEVVSKIGSKIIWPLFNTLIYPVYAEFDRRVHRQFKAEVEQGVYDLVHAVTPMMPRYPVKIVKACDKTPFIFGPVNGGVPFPEGFGKVANQEFAYLNFLRAIGRYLIPGYRRTYEKAAHVLAGSSYTYGMVKDLFNIQKERLELFYENGIKSSFLKEAKKPRETGSQQPVNLLFVGRLVPYKGADMLLEALGKLDNSLREKFKVTIVGDGSERKTLDQLVDQYQLRDQVHFAGWVTQDETLKYYSEADVFCFPSVREFGGAVVLEAMANGLPCIVVNNGGIGEYVTEKTGFKIDPVSREYVVDELTKCIPVIIEDHNLRLSMSAAAIDYVSGFTWDAKAKDIIGIYNKVLDRNK